MTFNIEFDYRYDVEGFYTAEARALLEIAAQSWESLIEDDFPTFEGGRSVEIFSPFFDTFSTVDFVTLDLNNDVDDLRYTKLATLWGFRRVQTKSLS